MNVSSRLRSVIMVALSMSVWGCTAPARAPGGVAYIGLTLQDDAEHASPVVHQVNPGPLFGAADRAGGRKAPRLSSGDVILAVNGRAMSRKEFTEFIRGQCKPGDRIVLRVERRGDTDTRGPAAAGPPSIDEIEVTLAAQDAWAGPIDIKRAADDRAEPADTVTVLADQTPLEIFLQGQVGPNQLTEPIQKLREMFRQTAESAYAHHTLSRVAYGFYEPTRLVELQRQITEPLPRIAEDPRFLLAVAADNLDVDRPNSEPSDRQPIDLSDPKSAVAQLAVTVAESARSVDTAFAKLDATERAAMHQDAVYLADQLAASTSPANHDDPRRTIGLLRRSVRVDFSALLMAMGHLSGLMGRSEPPPADTSTARRPWGLRRAVTGPLLAATRADGRWIIYGGFGDNTYDLSQIDVVVDPGGNDTYVYPARLKRGVQVVVDLAGDDEHLGDGGGPAAGCAGVSLVVDYSGNDRYEGTGFACGAGLFGVGILLDHDGVDRYVGQSWSLGTALYGLGAVLDLGAGNDTYIAQKLSEGLGGPRGFGLIFDAGGNDLYRANGPVPSMYGTPAVYTALSQGVGFGLRQYDAGGIGLIADQDGHDRYEAGEFSQGCGYFWGLGILHDRSGDDLYYGNRYSQGSAAHQAVGILADDAGHDTYWAMTAAGQGAAWDQSLGLLIDLAGNDTYRAADVGQGGAAQQAIALLVDLDGTDHYRASGSAVQGKSGQNTYHADTGCFSWSIFLDAGGGLDHYPTGRANDQVLSPGELNETTPTKSTLHGLFIDTAEKVRLWP